MSIVAKYKCTQEELYTTSNAIITSLQEFFPSFAAFSPEYNQLLVDGLKEKLATARNLPSEAVRDEITETQMVKLRQACTTGTNLWQTLKIYIQKTYGTEDFIKPKLDAAGAEYYTRASHYNWEAAKSLFALAQQFMGDNSVALSVKMPAAFPPLMTDIREQFENLYNESIQMEENRTVDVQKKIIANNELYVPILSVCTDGKDIFKNDASLADQFTWDTVVGISGGTHNTAFKGYLVNETTDLPIEGVIMTSTDKKYKTTTNEEGRYEYKQITAGTHSFKIEKEGYETEIIEVLLNAGVAKTLTIKLKAVTSQVVVN